MNSTFSASLQSPPSLLRVVRAQLFALIHGFRKVSLILLVLIVIPLALQLAGAFPEDTAKKTLFEFLPYSMLVISGLLFPLGVWRAEEPARRVYHWSMPVSRHAHSIIKTFAGWFWLLAGIALYTVIRVFANMLLPMSASEPASFVIPGPVSQWILLFAGPSIVYLLMSALVIVSGHPWRWIGGIVIGYMTIFGIFASLKLFPVIRFLSDLIFGQYGLMTALRGSFLRIGGHPKVGVTYTLNIIRDSEVPIFKGPAFSMAAVIVWMIVAIIAVCATAYWRSQVPPRSE